jgi:HEAT repeat protein
MKSRRSGVEARISAAEQLLRLPPDPAATRAAVSDRSSLVVAAAARAAAKHGLDGLMPELLAALDRHYCDPVESDPQCHAKTALLAALAALGHLASATYLRAARHRQYEPVWGGREDSAARLRICAAEALTRNGSPELYRILAEHLADPSHEVRSAAARLTGEVGGERGALLLTLRLHLPDPEADLVGDYAAGLLAADGATAVPLVAALLGHADPVVAGGVALALGASRLPEAYAPLATALDGALRSQQRADLLAAIALLRCGEAAERLLQALADGGEDAVAAAGHLRLYRDRPEVMQRARALVAERPELLASLASDS